MLNLLHFSPLIAFSAVPPADISSLGPVAEVLWCSAPVLLGIGALSMLVALLEGPVTRSRFWRERVRGRLLLRLDPRRHRVLENVYIPRLRSRGAMTQMDQVVFSVHGIFVIEIKEWSGHFYGGADERRWMRVGDGGCQTLLSPLKQNKGHLCALAKFLGLPPHLFHSVVWIRGDAKLKSRQPRNVIRSGRALVRHIARQREVLWSEEEMLAAWQRLAAHDAATDKAAARERRLAWRAVQQEKESATHEISTSSNIAAQAPLQLVPLAGAITGFRAAKVPALAVRRNRRINRFREPSRMRLRRAA